MTGWQKNGWRGYQQSGWHSWSGGTPWQQTSEKAHDELRRIPGAEWHCKLCGNKNQYTKKMRCLKCGVKIEFGYDKHPSHGAGQQIDSADDSKPRQPAQNTVRSALEDVAAALTKAATSEGPKKDARTLQPSCAAMDVPMAKVRIKALENSLASLPEEEEFQTLRDSLSEKLESLKSSISDSKPIGARIDAARAMLGRAQQRRAEAERAKQLADTCLQSANDEVDRVATELASLEAALAAAPTASTSNETESCSSGTNRLDHLQATLEGFLTELGQNDHVAESLTQEAALHCQRLVSGLRGTLKAANEAEKAAKNPKRMVGKQPNPTVATHPTPAGRVVRKESRRTLDEWFRGSAEKKVKTENSFSPLSESGDRDMGVEVDET